MGSVASGVASGHLRPRASSSPCLFCPGSGNNRRLAVVVLELFTRSSLLLQDPSERDPSLSFPGLASCIFSHKRSSHSRRRFQGLLGISSFLFLRSTSSASFSRPLFFFIWVLGFRLSSLPLPLVVRLPPPPRPPRPPHMHLLLSLQTIVNHLPRSG